MSGLLGRLLTLPRSNTGKAGGRGPAKLIGERHSSRRDQAAIQYHYDVSNDFYALWLDREMQYSCAYFITPSDSLETAQEQKMDLICRKLRLQEGERLLDIGCGWGGLARYAARTRGVSVLGITLSREQARFASEKAEEEGLSDRVAIQLRDYRDLAGEQFDKIVSIGMAEHVGQKRLLGYFQNAYGCLRPGGLFLNHAISFLPLVHGLPGGETAFGTYYGRRLKQGWLVEKVANWFLGPMSFTQAYFFPDGELIPVTVMDLAAEQAGFEVRDVENLREHYALTLRHWVQRMAAHQAEMEQAASGVTYRTWRIYMASSAYSFESGRIGLHQSLLAKPDQGRANLPLTRHDLYR
jgi:cyclopropane-fatty-acyl-phospholipid synthase